MPSLSNAVLCAAVAGLVWTSLGFALARWIGVERGLALAIAPALGWAALNAAALPLLLTLGLTRATAALLCVAALALAALLPARAPAAGRMPGPSFWAYAAAALLALAPAAGLVPKLGNDGVRLAAPMYDHAKIALIDDIARLGLPAGNPFIGGEGPLGYYYLWHFGAAIPAKLLGVSGWEADIALTWLTAFASLSLMMGLAAALAGRRGAALWVAPLSLAASLRPLIGAALGKGALFSLFADYQPPQGWLAQASWVPQHLAAADCAVLAALLIARLATEPSRSLATVLAFVAAAGCESSAWIGGVTFAAAALPLGATLLAAAEPNHRRRFLAFAAAAAVLAAALASPMLREEYAMAAARAVGVPIALHPYEVLGPLVPEGLRRILDPPAFWLVLLVIEFPAIYLAGIGALTPLLAPRTAAPERRLALALAASAGSGLAVSWLFASTIANNDLGWRAALPAVLALTVFAAAGLARWLALTARGAAAAALALLLLGLPGGLALLRDNAVGIAAPSDAAFAGAPALWQAVREVAAPEERVANNPDFLGDLIRWPVNLSWALFADRRSCFASWDLAHAYAALPGAEIDALDRLFKRVFAGTASTEEVRSLATARGCRVIVVTPADGAWRNDPFAASGAFRLAAEKAQAWRIYRAAE
ncbi:MAG TPA: hypothetical protein VEI03_22910 [Stellaceae bacterium]|nr:hypothetical protein [Stellaceae bacterium]